MKKFIVVCTIMMVAIFAYGDTKISQLPLKSAANTGASDSFPYVNVTDNETDRLLIHDLINIPSFQTKFNSMIPSQSGQSGKCLKSDGSNTVWGTCFTIADEPANTVYAGPTSGADDTPAFRALVIDDIPDLSSLYGSVYSVALSLPGIFNVTGSPVTSSGTLSATLASQSQNLVFSSPNGSSGAPSFRSLVASDIPSLSGIYATTSLSNISSVAIPDFVNILPASDSVVDLGSAVKRFLSLFVSDVKTTTIRTSDSDPYVINVSGTSLSGFTGGITSFWGGVWTSPNTTGNGMSFEKKVRFCNSCAHTGSNYIEFGPPASFTGPLLFTLPPNNGTSGYVLSTDGAGITSWIAQSSAITQLTGDVTAGPGSGSQAATVARIRGVTVSATSPTSGQSLAYNSTSTQWEPQTVAGTGANTALSNLTTTAINQTALIFAGAAEIRAVTGNNAQLTGGSSVGGNGGNAIIQGGNASGVGSGGGNVILNAGVGVALEGHNEFTAPYTLLKHSAFDIQHQLRFGAPSTASGYVGFQARNTLNTQQVIWQLPNADGTSGQALTTDGGTGLGWTTFPTLTPTNHGVVISGSGQALTATAAGSAGQVLQSGGASADPSYSTATFPSTATANAILYASASNTWSGLAGSNTSALVSSSSGVPSWASGATANRLLRTDGTTVSFSQAALATDVSGTLPIANGGTGQTTQQAALNALASTQTSGQYLRGNGTNVVMSAIQVADVPTLNQNTTGTASNITASSNTSLTSLANLATVGTITSGTWNGTTIDVAHGGTGQTTYTNGQLLIGNTTGNTLAKSTLTAGNGIGITNGTGSITLAVSGAAGTNVLTSGTTYTTPATVTSTSQFKFTLVGGGGGGAGQNTASTQSPGGGGGDTCIVFVSGLAASTGYTVAIGAAGAAGASNNGTGGNGGNTTISINATTYTAAGGTGAVAGASTAGGAGGSGTNCSVDTPGSPGGSSFPAVAGTPSGAGGSSRVGFGGASALGGAGNAGSGFGGGGSGGANNGGPNRAGGAGTQGLIIVEWVN